MQFWEARSTFNMMSKQCKQAQYPFPWKTEMEMLYFLMNSNTTTDLIGRFHSVIEYSWARDRRPYYNLYPSVIEPLVKLNLDLDSALIEPPTSNGKPIKTFYIHLPKAKHAMGDMQNILVSFESTPDKPAITVGGDRGGIAKYTLPNGTLVCYPTVTVIRFSLIPGRTIEEAINSNQGWLNDSKGDLSEAKSCDMEQLADCLRIVVSICLIGNGDEMLVSPDILNKDKDKWKGASEEEKQHLIERAKNRGKFGFNIGETLEVIPHYRRGHPFLAWTGPGRKIPKVVWRRGTLVHREVVEKIPTGYKE